MNTNRKNLLALMVVALAAMTTCVSPATAQSSGGKFTLPCNVQWQGQALPAGHYTFTLRTPSLPATVILKGPDGRGFVAASALDESPMSRTKQSTLTIEQRGGASFVSEIYLADLGLHLFYNPPKAANGERQLAQGPVSREEILIARK